MTLHFYIFRAMSQKLSPSSTATSQQSNWSLWKNSFPFLARGQAPKWGNVEVADLLCFPVCSSGSLSRIFNLRWQCNKRQIPVIFFWCFAVIWMKWAKHANAVVAVAPPKSRFCSTYCPVDLQHYQWLQSWQARLHLSKVHVDIQSLAGV